MIKIGDFGVARVMENTIAKARTVVGSPYYLSPEIIENRPYSYKTDISVIDCVDLFINSYNAFEEILQSKYLIF